MLDLRMKLILDYPFFGALALSLPLKRSRSVPYAGTDSKNIYYNPDIMDNLSKNDRLFIYIHEIFHVIFLHSFRQKNRAQDLWNVATDYAINLAIVKETHLQKPEIGLFDSRYDGMSAEEIYDKLKKDQDSGKDMSDEIKNSQIGEVYEPPSPSETKAESGQKSDEKSSPSESSVKEATEQEVTERDIKSKIVNADRATGYSRHCNSEELRGQIESITKTEISWISELSSFIDETYSNQLQYNWMRPDPKYMSQNILLPSLEFEKKYKIVVAIDTSGSVNFHLLQKFIEQFNGLVSSVDYQEIIVIGCSTQVNSIYRFTEGQKIEDLYLRGGGGTRFHPVFDWVKENAVEPSGLIYFTDLKCLDFGDPPPYPVLWLSETTEKDAFWLEHGVPFGKVVKMDE